MTTPFELTGHLSWSFSSSSLWRLPSLLSIIATSEQLSFINLPHYFCCSRKRRHMSVTAFLTHLFVTPIRWRNLNTPTTPQIPHSPRGCKQGNDDKTPDQGFFPLPAKQYKFPIIFEIDECLWHVQEESDKMRVSTMVDTWLRQTRCSNPSCVH